VTPPGIAMIFHFQSLDLMIYKKYKSRYSKSLRWIFAFVTLIGWVIAIFSVFDQVIFALLTSFFAGILIKTTIREKIPDQVNLAPISPFLLGVILYVAIIYFLQF